MTGDAILSAQDAWKHIADLTRAEVRQEPELAKVDSEHRALTVRHLPGSPEDRPIAAEDQGHVGTGIAEVLGLEQVRDGHIAALAQEGEQPIRLLTDSRTLSIAEHKHTHGCTSKGAVILSERHIGAEKGREKYR
jgi:hypothetical protein